MFFLINVFFFFSFALFPNLTLSQYLFFLMINNFFIFSLDIRFFSVIFFSLFSFTVTIAKPLPSVGYFFFYQFIFLFLIFCFYLHLLSCKNDSSCKNVPSCTKVFVQKCHFLHIWPVLAFNNWQINFNYYRNTATKESFNIRLT